MDISKAINIAVGCVMGSYVENGTKHLVIDKLREVEQSLQKIPELEAKVSKLTLALDISKLEK
jgi:hypothetical protein